MVACCIVLWAFMSNGYAQYTNVRIKSVTLESDSVLLDSLSIIPGSLLARSCIDSSVVLCEVDYLRSVLRVKGDLVRPVCLLVEYRVWPAGFKPSYYHKDLAMIRSNNGGTFNPYKVGSKKSADELLGQDGLQKSGSVSRGISFGNAQNLTVNSTLNLQLSGKLNERYSVLASVTDDNIPVQPNGNTAQLQDFDQVFIQLYNEKSKLVAGDFILRKPDSYFLNYFKRAQGGYFSSKQTMVSKRGGAIVVNTEASAAVSKGRFARNTIQGVEGNQGPYRLKGAENELFIIVLAGTEAVYIDGKRLERGQDKDYVIDYNAAEVVFTPRQLITKDRRIAVEFQYSEKRYARPMLQASVGMQSDRGKIYLHAYAEGDAKNQPLQQELNAEDRAIMAAAGDNLLAASKTGIQQVAFSGSAVLYAMRDTLGFDSVFVYSTDSVLAKYRVTFTQVGTGLGDYVEDGFTANGKKYKWVEPLVTPEGISHQGSFAPVIVLATPKKNQMFVAGGELLGRTRGNRKSRLFVEGALSNRDLNTFSGLDQNDNLGGAFKTVYAWEKLPNDSSLHKSKFSVNLGYEYTGQHFQRVERFREVEFERNWNLLDQNLARDFHLVNADMSWTRASLGSASLGGEALVLGEGYTGYKAKLATDFLTKKFKAWSTASFLETNGAVNSKFLRHRSDLYRNFGKIKLAFKDEHELNTLYAASSNLPLLGSYQFYDWQASVGTIDSLKTQVSVYFRERTDLKPDSLLLSAVTRAGEYGLTLARQTERAGRFNVIVSNRRLRVVDPERFTSAPENTLLLRAEHNGKSKSGFIQSTTFYEVGSGLEQKREFVYLEVQPGQGIYIWNDYNNNGVKELNEFEVAQFSYEANYIRTFVQSNEYVRVFSNQFSQSLVITPERLYKNPVGWQKMFSRFSSQTSYKVDRKTGKQEGDARFNPFLDVSSDTALVATTGSFRQVFFFNKTSPTFGLDFTLQQLRGKSLLSNGYESREEEFQQLGGRWNLFSTVSFLYELKQGVKRIASDFLTGRNYRIQYATVNPRLSWQYDNQKRFQLLGEWTEKQNTTGEERARIWKLGLEANLNALDKGLFQVTLDYFNITYNGSGYSAVGFEMLEGLNSGNNFTWSAGVQRTVAKNLQLSINYNGRKPEGVSTIHAGGLQLKAFF